MGIKEIIGCILMGIAAILAVPMVIIPTYRHRKRKNSGSKPGDTERLIRIEGRTSLMIVLQVFLIGAVLLS